MELEIELKKLPGVDTLLQLTTVQTLVYAYGRGLTVEAIRSILADARQEIKRGAQCPSETALLSVLSERLETWGRSTLRPAINATGVVIHTNLGRAPLSEDALQAMVAVGKGYSNLEYDLEAGRRGSRYVHAEDLLCRLTGAQAALVVNNNAAAVLLALSALARDGEVVISRGQLVEIGGGFRIPDVMHQSGARLVEVGTTNRTHLYDYERAIGPDTTMLMLAHQSNFRTVGFTAQVSTKELVQLGHVHDLVVYEDLGSGTLLRTEQYGFSHEPTVQEAVAVVQRRQAARCAASRHPRRQKGPDRASAQTSADACIARGQDDFGRPAGYAFALLARGCRTGHSGVALVGHFPGRT